MLHYQIYIHNGMRYIRLHEVTNASMIPRIGETIRIDLIKGGPTCEDYKVVDVIHRIFKSEECIYIIVKLIPKADQLELY